jgi:hypothetical protein
MCWPNENCSFSDESLLSSQEGQLYSDDELNKLVFFFFLKTEIKLKCISVVLHSVDNLLCLLHIFGLSQI